MENMLFDLETINPLEKFMKDLQERCDFIVTQMHYPEHCLAVVKKIGKTVTSYSVVINEPSAPFGKVDPSKSTTGNGVLYMKESGSKSDADKIVIHVDERQDYFTTTPASAEKSLKEPANAPKYYEIKMRLVDPELLPYLEKIIFRELSNYVTREPVFGCCNLYVECSDSKKCLHQNPMYATACAYRKNLESGRIFYGKNKNI